MKSIRLSSAVLFLAWFAQTCPAQADSRPAEAEVAAILAELKAAIGSFEQPPGVSRTAIPDFETSMQKLTAVAARIDLVEASFGIRPESLQGWKEVQAAARSALDPRQLGVKVGGIYFAASSSDMGRAILREISGDLDAAFKILDGIKAGGGCGNWIATVSLAVNTRKSAILQKKGEYEKALEAHERAIESVRWALHSKNLPALCVRHAWLLEKNGRAETAFTQYQRVVDLFPGTTADVIARGRLLRAGKIVPPTADRLKVYLESDDRIEAVKAIGVHRFPDSFDILSELMPREEQNAWVSFAVIEALGSTGDRRAIPLLQARVATIAPNQLPEVLLSLAKLGDTSKVLPALERIDAASYVRVEELQPLLARLYPDGPKFGPDDLDVTARPSRFTTPWIDYIKAHPAASRPAPR